MYACASINSAKGLKSFIDLRDASSFVALDYQAKTILENLNNALSKRKISAYHILCAVEMLLHYGNKKLLNELLKPKHVPELLKYFAGNKPMETQQMLAKHVYVRP